MHIAVFGASIAYGSWDLEKGGWVNRLRLHLDHDSHYHLVYNFGVPGNNSADLIKRVGAQAPTVEPDIIIVSIGINDSALLDDKTNHVDAQTYQSNVREILHAAKQHAKRVIFLGLTPVDERQTAPVGWDEHVFYRNKEIIRYNEAAKKTCEEEAADFMDVYEKLSVSEVYRKSLGDGLHPDASGHQLIFEAVLSALAL